MRSSPVVMALCGLLMPAAALASSETDLPPALRADVSVGYEVELEWAGLSEDTDTGMAEVGRRRETRHEVDVRAAFAPVDGVAVTLGLDHVPDRAITFVSGQRMLLDPVTGKGSSLSGPALDPLPETRGSGLLGVWLGMAFQPFAEHFDKQHEVTWRLDVAVRTAPSRTFWEVDEEGRRGAGNGGPTFKLAAAFSRDHGSTSPYMTVDWRLQTRRPVSIADGSGGTVEVQVDPGQTLDVRGGIEIQLSDPKVDVPRVDFDLHAGFGYRSPTWVPSGIFLPDVLPSTQGTISQRAERLGWHVGAAFDMDFAEQVGMRLWSRMFWALPAREEHPYGVTTSLDTVQAGFGVELIGRIR